MGTLELPKKLGHYTLFRLLGKGGMGEVYLAEDQLRHQQVAIKIVRGDVKERPELRSRFSIEARAATALNHPNIVSVFEVGEFNEEESLPYLVMEFVEGDSLEHLLTKRRLTIDEVLTFAIQIVEGLQAAHQRRIVHRDIKPSNLMVTSDSRIKILDFGLSKWIHESTPDGSTQIKNTSDGAIVGTIGYLSPEQALGNSVDLRSDIFSFGVVLYQMLTREHPFPGTNAVETLAKIVTQAPQPWPKSLAIPSPLKRIVNRCLQKEPANRYLGLTDLLADLQAADQIYQSQRNNLLDGDDEDTSETLTPMPKHRVATNDSTDYSISDAPTLIPPEMIEQQHRSLWRWMILAGVLLAIGLGIGYRWYHHQPAQVFKSNQITFSTGLDVYPSFSPDGRSIAYSSDRNGNFEIYIKQLGPGGQEIQLTDDGKQNLQPAWSPDGRSIAYYSKSRGGIWVVSTLGGAPGQLTEFGSRPAWSPDGRSLAFQSDPLSDVSANAFAAMPPSTIYIAALENGQPQIRKLTETNSPAGGHGAPAWSPDGKRIAFVTYNRRVAEIYSVTAQGDDLVRVVSNQLDCYDPVYAIDGQSIYYCAVSRGNDYGLWQQAVVPGSGRPQGEPKQIANLGVGAIKQLAISGDGQRLIYSSLSISSNIWTVPLDAEGQTAGKPKGLTADTSRNSRPTYSPDGSRLAFNRALPGTSQDLWLMDADGRNIEQLTTNTSIDMIPSWYPGGDRLAFYSNRGGQFAVWSISLQNRQESLLLRSDQDLDYPQLSPDGARLAFSSKRDGATNVWVAELASGKLKQITFDKELIGFPCWSPNGKYLALELKRGEDTHVAIVPAEGGPVTQLTFENGQSWVYSWSPDGDKIAFAGQRDDYWNIWWVSLSTKKQQQVTDYARLNAYVRYPSWSPKGDRIAYEYAETTGNIWLLETVK